MSKQYPGGIISKTAPTPSGPYADSTAPGVWTLEQQAYWQKLGQWPTAGNVNPSAFIENLFSTYLYTGNGSTQTITNGIDLAGEGGLVWIKDRTTAGSFHRLTDTERGAGYTLGSNATNGQSFIGQGLQTFTSTGFSIGSNADFNQSSDNYVSWTLRKQPKFFDVVTYTGTGSAKTVAHNLGSVPGCIIVKATNSSTYWATYHTSLGNTKAIELNTTNSAYTSSAPWNNTSPTSTQFTVGTSTDTNDSGITYIAYLFAHNAGGFGLTGSDNVISCGSFTTGGSGDFSVTLGYEPQWVLLKQSSGAGGSWVLFDTMRGMSNTNVARLIPNTSGAETNYSAPYCVPSATGFYSTAGGFFDAGETIIYIAIRRGPMKVPTSGTSVFAPIARTGTQTNNTTVSGAGFAPDLVMAQNRAGITGNGDIFFDKLRGAGQYLNSASTGAEGSAGNSSLIGFTNDGFITNSDATSGYINYATTYANWLLQRAPSFFDEVCYTGTGVANTAFNHNLTVTPELMIFKPRSAATAPNWRVWSPIDATNFNLLALSTNGAASSSAYSSSNVFPAAPTATTFTVGGSGSIQLNESGQTFVAYLFASCPGVSKVGSYTGTGTTKQVDCGFTGGARFVLIKRTDSTGDWYVWDSARGIVAGNDPYLLLNSTAAEVTNTDYVDTYSAGFEISSTAPAAINASGGTFIFLAIA